MTASSSILLSPSDNVAVANGRLEVGASLPGGAVTIEVIEPGHKVATHDIAAGEAVVKYAQAIGKATRDIKAGEHVHSHNLAFESGRMPVVPPGEAQHASEADKARRVSDVRRAPGPAPGWLLALAWQVIPAATPMEWVWSFRMGQSVRFMMNSRMLFQDPAPGPNGLRST